MEILERKEKRKYMQNIHLLLQRVKGRRVLHSAIYCSAAVLIVAASREYQSGKQTTALVYAQARITASSLDAGLEEAAKFEQIQLEEMPCTAEQASIEAMQLDLAEEIARKEKKARIAAARKRARQKALEEKKIYLTEKETKILQRIVEAEATGQDVTGKMLVANVVLNRVNSDRFPDSVEEVVFAPGQFSPIKDGRYYSVSITDTTKDAVERVLNGEDASNGALFFMSRNGADKNNARWFDNNLVWIQAYGGHDFFK